MDSAPWAWFPFLATRGHSPRARRAVHCGYWLPSRKSVTPLLHWKHRFKVLSLNSPRAELHLLWVLTWTSTRACAPPKQAEDVTHCLKQRPVRWRTPGSCTGQLCHTGTVPWASGIVRGDRSHATVANSNGWTGEKVAAGGKGQKKSQLKNKCLNTQTISAVCEQEKVPPQLTGNTEKCQQVILFSGSVFSE